MHSDIDTKEIASKININMSIVVRKVALDGMTKLIKESPVDTGRFKANWSTSINAMNTKATEETKSNINNQSKGIASYNLGQTMFLHNNLEYAVPLEYGHSAQAPKGWVRNTAIEMQKKINEIKDLI